MANLNINKVIIGGRLTADIELKATPAGVAVAKFTIATNRRGSKDGATDFIDCVAWRQTAEFIAKYFGKASSICIVGELQKRSYKDKDGNTRYITEVNANEAYFVDSKSEATQAGQPPTPTAYNTAGAPNSEEISPDDDLPF
jgi:single-strand DNA-binding protein